MSNTSSSKRTCVLADKRVPDARGCCQEKGFSHQSFLDRRVEKDGSWFVDNCAGYRLELDFGAAIRPMLI